MSETSTQPIVHIIDDDEAVRNSISMSLSSEGLITKDFSSAVSFLQYYKNHPGCIVTDIEMPEMSGMELQQTLKENNVTIPIVFITGQGNISLSVQAMKSGAVDFIEKPFEKKALLKSIQNALTIDDETRKIKDTHQEIQGRFDMLTVREKHICFMLTREHGKYTNKDIAEQLGISKRTVEVHRSSVMSKMHASTRAQLVELSKYCDLDSYQGTADK